MDMSVYHTIHTKVIHSDNLVFMSHKQVQDVPLRSDDRINTEHRAQC